LVDQKVNAVLANAYTLFEKLLRNEIEKQRLIPL